MLGCRCGYFQQDWCLPDDWRDVNAIDVYSIDLGGYALRDVKLPVDGTQISLSLRPDEAVLIVPHGTRVAEKVKSESAFGFHFAGTPVQRRGVGGPGS